MRAPQLQLTESSSVMHVHQALEYAANAGMCKQGSRHAGHYEPLHGNMLLNMLLPLINQPDAAALLSLQRDGSQGCHP